MKSPAFFLFFFTCNARLLVIQKTFRIFAADKLIKLRIMEARKVTFTAKPGTFRDAVRAYKKYKDEKEQRLERKLQQLEEEIQKAKADTFYKIDMA